VRPQFIPKYVETDLYDILRAEVPWVNRDSPRDECFMAAPEAPRTYSYGNNNERREALHTMIPVPPPRSWLDPGTRYVTNNPNWDRTPYWDVDFLNIEITVLDQGTDFLNLEITTLDRGA